MKRYKSSNLLFLASILIVIVSFASCGQPPEEEMAAARQAVEEAAGNPDVRQYAPRTLEEAQQLLSEMESAAENKEYDAAGTLAGDAHNAAERAGQEAESAKSRVQSDAEGAIAAATTDLDEAREALNVAREVRGIRLDFRAAGGELEAEAGAIAAAEADFQNELFSDAISKAEDARSSISDVLRRIGNAVQAASRK